MRTSTRPIEKMTAAASATRSRDGRRAPGPAKSTSTPTTRASCPRRGTAPRRVPRRRAVRRGRLTRRRLNRRRLNRRRLVRCPVAKPSRARRRRDGDDPARLRPSPGTARNWRWCPARADRPRRLRLGPERAASYSERIKVVYTFIVIRIINLHCILAYLHIYAWFISQDSSSADNS